MTLGTAGIKEKSELGFGIVDPTGQWVEMSLAHFSNHDPNYPVENWSLSLIGVVVSFG